MLKTYHIHIVHIHIGGDMKRLHTGVILLDTIDIICLSFSAGSTLAYFYKFYKTYKNRRRSRGQDPLVTDLKKKSPILMFSEDGKPLKVPLLRGGDKVRGLSLISVVIKNKKLANLLRALIHAERVKRRLRVLRLFFFTLNSLLSTSVGLRIALGGSLDYTQIIIIGAPSTVGGFLVGLTSTYPLASALLPLLPLAIFYGRGIEDIPDPSRNCRVLCKVVEEFHNKQLGIEMTKFNSDSLVEDASAALQLPLDQRHLICVEDKRSMLERFKLREVIKSEKARKRVQHFSEFIKKFPECDADPKVTIAIVEKIAE